jgi:hypothetical protein
MSDLLWSEYRERLAAAAAKWGADDGANVTRNNEARWTCPLGSCTVVLRLRMLEGGGARGKMLPELSVTSAASCTGNAHTARARMASGVATIDKGLSALCEVEGYAVWMGECPCGYCSGRGKTGAVTCSYCGGTGWRKEETGPA